MCFEDDIFISYTHIDNQPLTNGQGGWISDFHDDLRMRLRQLRGREANIWRDEKLQGNDYFSDIILERFPRVALLVAILSPWYVRSSKWCARELREFCRAAEQNGGVRVAGKSRIFKVIKTPVPRNEHPPEIQGLLGYEFYQCDQIGRPVEFNRIFGPDAERSYWIKLNDLAYDICQLLEMLEQLSEEPPNNGSAATGTTIYLAETTFDLADERDNVKRELQQRGYMILPDQSLSHNSDFQRVVCENLEHCTLSIHLIGERYGVIPEGVDRSVVDLQIELAAIRGQENPGFSSLIWMPRSLQVQEPRQEEFIRSLEDAPELLQTPLEELMTIIQDRLNFQQETPEELVTPQEGLIRVYLIYDQRDLEAIRPLDEHLYDQGFEVIPPIFEDDEVRIRQHHQESLQLCDAVMIYYGNGNEPWVQTKLRDLRGIDGYGRSNPMLARAIYVSGPQTDYKDRFRTREALVIRHFEVFSPDLLEPFLAQIARGQGGLH